MRLKGLALWALRIPLVEAFRHGASGGAWCESIVVRVEDDGGEVGYGEGVPRPGETAESITRRIADLLWPAIADRDLPEVQEPDDIVGLAGLLPPGAGGGLAGRCALELAILDCQLHRRNRCMTNVLPPVRQKVTYSGIIAARTMEEALHRARQMKTIGMRHFKIEVGHDDDVERIRAIREALGQQASLRLDAGGRWTHERALEVLWSVASCRIEAVEQPLPRGPVSRLARLKRESPVAVMADESLVTMSDAEELIAAGAVDFFDIGVSKCGGLSGALALVHLARRHGVRFQISGQTCETAILAGAGRHLAAHLEDVSFVEGSFGTLALSEDVSPDGVRFGHRGEAPVLLGKGLGVRVLEDRLRKYAAREISRVVSRAPAREHRTEPRPGI